jgi:putative ATP-binding cassette transporter
MMEVLSQELKHVTVVSIGHRGELAAFHHRKIILVRGKPGARLVDDARSVRSAGRVGQLRCRAGHDPRTSTAGLAQSA